ncbi:hypothetical protein EYF80_033406 [Liparis tanakae]|uniref:Uncharacterized protein n=1 Tax=Liparis tanakae TaxID=230148 RepID=A0A4Z2GT07_9TELE|nr:hypothetical protein EYF80_033406 [Liparis tanakae]
MTYEHEAHQMVLRALTRVHRGHICPRAPRRAEQMSTGRQIAAHQFDVQQRRRTLISFSRDLARFFKQWNN